MPSLPTPAVRFVPLPPQALENLLAGDLAAARTITGVPLPDWFLTDEVTWLWRMRLDQISRDAEAADWIVRAAVSVPDGVVIGAGGFHGPPDDAGMVEIGYSTDPSYRRRGYARAMVAELLRWAAAEPRRRTMGRRGRHGVHLRAPGPIRLTQPAFAHRRNGRRPRTVANIVRCVPLLPRPWR